MLLVHGCLVGRAHHGTARMFVLPALAHPNAAVGGLRERPAIVGVAEVEILRRRRLPRSAKPEVDVERRRVHDLSWIHLVVRAEYCLELAERLDPLSAEHLGQQLAPTLPA